jgi:hypothetical protein
MQSRASLHCLQWLPPLQDLARAQVQFADAVFIMADKSPQDARQQDLQNSMACLAVGQYCLQLQRSQARHGPNPLSEQLAQLVRDVEAKLRPVSDGVAGPTPWVLSSDVPACMLYCVWCVE